MVLRAHAVPWWISHSCDIEAKNEFGDGEWTPAWELEGCSHISDFLMGMIRYLLHSPACVKFKALCLVWYIKIMLHTMAKLLCSHGTLFTDTASSSWRVWDTTPTQKIVPFSGMITEARKQFPIDYTEPVEEIRRKIILTVWMTSIHFETAQQAPSVNHNGYQSTLNSMLKRVLP